MDKPISERVINFYCSLCKDEGCEECTCAKCGEFLDNGDCIICQNCRDNEDVEYNEETNEFN